MDYIITSGQGLTNDSKYVQFERLIVELVGKLNSLEIKKLNPKLIVNVDSIKEGEDIILSYSVEKWPSYVYLITKGDDLIEMSKRLFGVLKNTLENKQEINSTEIQKRIDNQL